MSSEEEFSYSSLKMALIRAVFFTKKASNEGLSIKDGRNQGGLSSTDILRIKEAWDSLNADVRTFGAKNFGFFVISVVSDGPGGEGQFCVDVFYGRPLSTNLHILWLLKLAKKPWFQFFWASFFFVLESINWISG